jgi:hypothetical protein
LLSAAAWHAATHVPPEQPWSGGQVVTTTPFSSITLRRSPLQPSLRPGPSAPPSTTNTGASSLAGPSVEPSGVTNPDGPLPPQAAKRIVVVDPSAVSSAARMFIASSRRTCRRPRYGA